MVYHGHPFTPWIPGELTLLYGTTHPTTNVSAIFLEAFREHGAWNGSSWIIAPDNVTATIAEQVTVAHEIGHQLGIVGHVEGTLINPGTDPNRTLNDDQIKTVRTSTAIEE
jgi:hypothetical protein